MYNSLKIGLKGYKLLQVFHDKELQLHVELKRSHEPKSCPSCFSSKIRSKGRYQRKVRHLECFGQDTMLHIFSRRFQCFVCKRCFLPSFPGVRKGPHSSEPFRNSIFTQHHHGVCASTLAKDKRLGAATADRIYQQFTKRKAAERISNQCPLYLGIDEHTLHKRQGFCTTFCDLKNHRIFEIQPGKSSKKLIKQLLSQCPYRCPSPACGGL